MTQNEFVIAFLKDRLGTDRKTQQGKVVEYLTGVLKDTEGEKWHNLNVNPNDLPEEFSEEENLECVWSDGVLDHVSANQLKYIVNTKDKLQIDMWRRVLI